MLPLAVAVPGNSSPLPPREDSHEYPRLDPCTWTLVIFFSVVLARYKGGTGRPHLLLGGFTGLFSGLLSGLFAIPGPPVIVYAMATESDPVRSRALLLTFFLFSSTMALPVYIAAGLASPASPWLFLFAFPAMYLGDRLGYRLFRRYGTAFYRRVGLMLLFVVGIVVTLKALQGGAA